MPSSLGISVGGCASICMPDILPAVILFMPLGMSVAVIFLYCFYAVHCILVEMFRGGVPVSRFNHWTVQYEKVVDCPVSTRAKFNRQICSQACSFHCFL